MTDPSEMEIAAMRSALAPLGEYVGAIGMERCLADYSMDQVLMLIEVAVTAYQSYMLIEHEREAAKDSAYFDTVFAAQDKVVAMKGGR